MALETISRRKFLRSLVGAGAAIAAGGAAIDAGRTVLAAPSLPLKAPARFALVIDTTKCVGCGACKEACAVHNQLPENTRYIHILSKESGAKPTFLPVQCQHCADPPCARVCPTKATYRRGDGVVLIDEKVCVGCRYCEVACPYQARSFDEERGVVDKCWLCLDLVMAGGRPACVDACILGARHFGRQDDPNSQVSRMIASGEAKPLHPELGTRPSILYYIM
jgi:Fe-S-cluster-containing dehydrogenase component